MMLAMECGFHIVNSNVRQVALQPAVAWSRVAADAADERACSAGIAYSCPRSDDEPCNPNGKPKVSLQRLEKIPEWGRKEEACQAFFRGC
jgi:hypothetical protein